MLDTLQNIGRIVRADKWGRIKNHPLLSTYQTDKGKGKTYIVHHIDVDTENRKVNIKGIVNPDSVVVLRYDKGGNTFPYLIGPIVDIKKLNHYHKCLENQLSLGVENEQVLSFAYTIRNNREQIDAYLKGQDSSNIIIDFTINGRPFQEIEEVMDEIDRIYINDITEPIPDSEYRLLSNSLLGFFKTSSKESYAQSPGFDKWQSYKSMPVTVKDINGLLYSVKFHEHIRGGNLVGDFFITYLPNIKNIPYSFIERILEDLPSQSYDALATKAKKIGDTRHQAPAEQPEEQEIDFTDPVIARAKLMERIIRESNAPVETPDINFDIIFKQKGGNTVMDVNLLSSVNITKIEQLNQRIREARQFASSGKRRYTDNLTSGFYWLFRNPTNKDIGPYKSFILKWVLEIFGESYYRNPLLTPTFIERVEYMLRNTAENGQSFAYESLHSHYKFLFFMQQNGKKQHDELLNSASYRLGVEMGHYCKVWQKDRRNLKSYITTLNGHLSQHVKTLEDVMEIFNEFTRRLFLNKAYIGDPVNIAGFPKDETFDPQKFIYGYYEAQLTFSSEKESKDESEEISAIG